MPDDLPDEWLATLDAILSAPASITPAARFWGAAEALIAAGWVARWEDGEGRANWTMTPWGAVRLGYTLIERIEGEPVWVRHDLDAAPHPDPPLVTTLHPRERRLPDASWLNVPDPHSDPARAEARRRDAPRKRPHRNRKGKRRRQGERRAAAERKAG
jgi:hypothetical protein